MTREAFFSHLLFAFCLFILSCVICLVMVRRVRIMDVPNERSSHSKPIPKSGGVVLVSTFLIGVIAIFLFGDATLIGTRYFFGFVCASMLVAAISFYDDINAKPFLFKLIGQGIAITVVLSCGIVIREITVPVAGNVQLGWVGVVVTVVWMLGLTNAYNFMDGLNGMAAGPAAIVACFLCVISFQAGSTFVYIICYTLVAGALGFLVFNFPKASLFMGDVGSAFLGFVFANLAVIAALYDHSHTSLFVVPLLLFNFIFDTSFTFVRRALNRENVFAAHRTHLYQLFNRMGYTHVTVSGFHFAVCFLQGIGAWIMVHITGNNRLLVFLPYLVFQSIYAIVLVRKAKARGIF